MMAHLTTSLYKVVCIFVIEPLVYSFMSRKESRMRETKLEHHPVAHGIYIEEFGMKKNEKKSSMLDTCSAHCIDRSTSHYHLFTQSPKHRNKNVLIKLKAKTP